MSVRTVNMADGHASWLPWAPSGIPTWAKIHAIAARELPESGAVFVNCPAEVWELLRADADMGPGKTQRWEWDGSGWIRSVGTGRRGFQHLLVRAWGRSELEMHDADTGGLSIHVENWRLP